MAVDSHPRFLTLIYDPAKRLKSQARRDVKLGRKPKLTPHQQREAIKRRDRGETVADIARSYNVHCSTISRLAG